MTPEILYLYIVVFIWYLTGDTLLFGTRHPAHSRSELAALLVMREHENFFYRQHGLMIAIVDKISHLPLEFGGAGISRIINFSQSAIPPK